MCVGLLGLVAVACVDELAEGAGEVLVDAGQMLRDAGAALVDAGDDVARAQGEDAGPAAAPKSETVEVACDKRYERTVTTYYDAVGDSPIGEPEHQVRWYAGVAIDTTAITGIDVLLCDLEQIDRVPCDGRTDGGLRYVCDGNFPAEARCVMGTAEIVDGAVRAPCGYAGAHHKSARLTIRR